MVGLLCVHHVSTFTWIVVTQGTKLSSWPAYIMYPDCRGSRIIISMTVPSIKNSQVLFVAPSHVDLCSQYDIVEITVHNYKRCFPLCLPVLEQSKGK